MIFPCSLDYKYDYILEEGIVVINGHKLVLTGSRDCVPIFSSYVKGRHGINHFPKLPEGFRLIGEDIGQRVIIIA